METGSDAPVNPVAAQGAQERVYGRGVRVGGPQHVAAGSGDLACVRDPARELFLVHCASLPVMPHRA